MTDAVSQPMLPLPQLIVGLGNPGEQYRQTRHNIGFMVLDRLAQSWQARWSEYKKFQAELAEVARPPQKLRLLKPLTYMNRSGQSVRAAIDWFKLSPDAVLVVYDDLDLPFGKLRLRLSGSAGGHNGMKSIIAHLGMQDFPRLRVGIGSPKQLPQGGLTDDLETGTKTGKTGNRGDDRQKTVSHVLGRFSQAEARVMDQVLETAAQAIAVATQKGTELAMNRYNGWSVSVE